MTKRAAHIDKDARLHRSVGLLGVVMLGAGTAIGVSIFTVLQPAAAVAGSGLLTATCVAAIPMILFAMVYAFMSSAVPLSGASFAWPARFIHPLAGFMIAWLRIIGSVGAILVLGTVLLNYLEMSNLPLFSAIPSKLAIALVISAIFFLNLVGVSIAARAQTAMMALLLAALTLFAVTGVGDMRLALVGNPLEDVGGILAAVPLMITLFLGIESATEIGEEVREAERTIPRGIAAAIALTTTVYLAVAVVALGLLGPDALAGSAAPLLEASRIGMGDWAMPVILSAATVSILKTLNAITLIFSRYLFAMGRSGVLPSAMGRVHPRFGTPHIALYVGWIASLVALLLPSSLVFLLLAVNIPTMFKYMASCLSAVRLVRRHPGLYERSRLGWSKRLVESLGMAGAVVAMLVILVGLTADWRPYVLILAWGLAGLLFWWVRGPRIAGLEGEPHD